MTFPLFFLDPASVWAASLYWKPKKPNARVGSLHESRGSFSRKFCFLFFWILPAFRNFSFVFFGSCQHFATSYLLFLFPAGVLCFVFCVIQEQLSFLVAEQLLLQCYYYQSRRSSYVKRNPLSDPFSLQNAPEVPRLPSLFRSSAAFKNTSNK